MIVPKKRVIKFVGGMSLEKKQTFEKFFVDTTLKTQIQKVQRCKQIIFK